MNILRVKEVKSTVKTAVIKDELGQKLSPFSSDDNAVNNLSYNSSFKEISPSKFPIQSSLNACIPDPYRRSPSYAGENVKVYGTIYGHQDGN